MKILKALFLLAVVVGSMSCETKQEAARNDISKTWKIQSVTRNGVDDTSTYLQSRGNYRITFDKESGFQETYTSFGSPNSTTVNGTYSINSGITQLNLESDFQSRAFTIDVLEEGNLNLTDQGSSDDLKIFHVPE